MTPEPEPPPNPAADESRFVEQALRALDGDLEPEGEALLRESLAADVDKRRMFVRLCLQTQALIEVLGPERRGLVANGLGRADGTDGLDFRRFVGRIGRRGWLPWTITAAACILAMLAGGLALSKRPGDGSSPARSSLAARDRAVSAVGRHVGAGFDDVALTLELEAARWDVSDGPAPARGDVLGARRLRLLSGRATFAFLSGVMLILEGPADVDLVSIDRVFCREGKLRARVPDGAQGFVIASRASAVVDRGTEFAVNVDADGRSRVLVFEGAAEAALLDAEGSPKLTQIVERSKSFELDPRAGTIAEAEARPDGFVRAPELTIPSLVLDPSYASTVLDARPRAYWRFESLEAGAVPNEVTGGAPLRTNGPVTISAGRGVNGFALFKAGDPDQFLFTGELWELAHSPGHAVELWFLSEGIRYASLVGLFPPKDYLAPGKHGRHIHTFLLELTAHDRGSLFNPASVRFLHRWPLDTRIGNNIVSERLYIPRRWQHVVAQKNGEKLELFLDGEPDRSTTLDPDHPTVLCRLVVGRRTPDPHDPQDRRPFVGRLDELAIYDHPLTHDQVRAHYRLATIEDPRE